MPGPRAGAAECLVPPQTRRSRATGAPRAAHGRRSPPSRRSSSTCGSGGMSEGHAALAARWRAPSWTGAAHPTSIDRTREGHEDAPAAKNGAAESRWLSWTTIAAACSRRAAPSARRPRLRSRAWPFPSRARHPIKRGFPGAPNAEYPQNCAMDLCDERCSVANYLQIEQFLRWAILGSNQ